MGESWEPPDQPHYSHLLGLYLGDGHLAAFPRTYRLVITCDLAYPALIDACRISIERTGLPRRVRVQPDPVKQFVRVVADSKRWPEVFPSTVPGASTRARSSSPAGSARSSIGSRRSPLRPLAFARLPDGQPVHDEAAERACGRVRVSALVLLQPLGRHPRPVLCDRLGIRWTQSNPRNISVSHRAAVALLDSFVPAKS
jgi:hypothetical protein